MAFSSLIMEQLTRILVEGRKDDALKRVVKGLKGQDVIQYVEGLFKTEILANDPSGNQKYAMWAAGMVNTRLVKMQKNYETGMQRDVDAAGNEIKYEASRRFSTIRNNIRKYHRLAEKNLIDKDINKFKDFGDWEQQIYVAYKELQARHDAKEREEKAKESSDVIDDADNWMMVRPNDEDGACYYGRGTKWCISATESRNWFDEYTDKEGKVFYFVLFKHLHNDDWNKKMALVYGADAKESSEPEPEEVYDVSDDEVGTDGLRDGTYSNLVMKGYALGQDNPKEFLKIFRSASGREGKDDKVFTGHEGAQVNPRELSSDVEDVFTEWMSDYSDGGHEDSGIAIPQTVMYILKGLGLGDPTEVDVHEAFEDLVSEDHWSILGQAGQHAVENPGGATADDYEEYIRDAQVENFNIYYEPIEDGHHYSASALIDLDETEGLAEDIDSFEDYVTSALNAAGIYPDNVEEDSGNRAYIRVDPDYDEMGWDGFKAFVDRVSQYDAEYENFRETLLSGLDEAGFFASEETYANLQRFEDMDLKHFDVDLEENKVTMTTFLPVRLYLPSELLTKVKSGVGPEGTEENRLMRAMHTAIHTGLRQNMHKLKDKIIARMQDVTDRALEIIASQQKLNLAETEAETGHPIPDYNINVGFKTARTGGTGLGGGTSEYKFADRIEVWLDVQLQGNEEPEALKIIEKFVKMADHDKFHERLRLLAEAIVTNMIVKEILPKFKKDYAYSEMRRQQRVAESSFSSFDDWKGILNEWRKYKK